MGIEQIERKTLDVKFTKSSFSEDDQYYYLSGYGSTFGNVDRGKDVINAGAFTKSLTEMFPKFCYQHDMQDPLGVFTEVKEDGRGLFINAKMRKGFEKTRWIAGLIEDGAIDSMSIGFGIPKGGWEYDAKTEVRHINEIKLYEVSLVTIPMNAEARLTAFKSEDADEIKSIRDVEAILKEAGFSVKQAKILISKTKELSPCDEGEEKEQRDVVLEADLSPLMEEIKKLTQSIQS